MKFWGLAQLRDLGQHVAGRRVGGVGAVGVDDRRHDSIAVVDGLDPCGGVLVAGASTSTTSCGALVSRSSASKRVQNGHREVAKTVTGDVVSGVVAKTQAFRSKRWKR